MARTKKHALFSLDEVDAIEVLVSDGAGGDKRVKNHVGVITNDRDSTPVVNIKVMFKSIDPTL